MEQEIINKLKAQEMRIEEMRQSWKEIDIRLNVLYKLYDELDEKLRRVKDEL